MTPDNTQITYEEGITRLPENIEQKLTETIEHLRMKIDRSQGTLSLYFCSPNTIRELNQTWRNKDRPTDLLSWLYDENGSDADFPETPWGELVYCLPVIQKQAADSGWELQDELLRLTVHGLVHLLGYDHENAVEEAEMLGVEKKLLKQVGLADMYSA